MTDSEPFLLAQHQALIEDSGISGEVALARGYRSVEAKQDLLELGFSRAQCRVPALLIPVWNAAGEIGTYQLRPDAPRELKGKTLKYETPKGSTMVVDVPPSIRSLLGDPSVPLLVTEGVRKADAAVSRGLCCIDVLGVWNWRGTNAAGGTTVLADFESIALNGREVYLGFDSDVTTKPSVALALRRFSGFLASRKARVKTILLAPGDDGSKVGLDDYLAAGHSTDDLFALVSDDVPEASGPAALRNGPYGVVGGCLAHVKRTHDIEEWLMLTNFSAEIVEEIIADDGVEERGVAIVGGRLWNGMPLPPLRVPLEKFESLSWIGPGWGTIAILAAGNGNRDRTREAIQRLSFNVVRRREYAHAGWRRIGGEWIFLSHGMAIGHNGSRPQISVQLEGAGQLLSLPDQGTARQDTAAAIAATLRLLDVAPDGITVPLLGAALRAVLNEITYADFSVFLVGPSGVLKSELAALIQRCSGPDFNRLTLPANWAATPNFLERIASDFKDCVLVIDDFAPAGTSIEVRKYHTTADRMIRGAGNASGRGRMNADGSLRPSYTPRALIVSTGEDVPQGFSIRARMLVIEIAKGDVEVSRLPAFQNGEDGRSLSQMMATYVRWLAPRIDDLRTTLPAAIRTFRAELSQATGHARSPDALANLGAAWHLWLSFAVGIDAVTQAARDVIWARVWSALNATTVGHATHLDHEHPVTRFLDLLRGCLASGAAHVAGPDGTEPVLPAAWGWRERLLGSGEYTRQEWQPQGKCVGWLDESGLFLEPQAVYSTVQQMGHMSGSNLTITPQTLWKRLDEAGLLCSTELETRGTRLIRKTFASARRATLHLPAGLLAGSDTDSDEGTANVPGTNANRRIGQDSWSEKTPPDATTDPNSPVNGPWNQAFGLDGQSGRDLRTGEGTLGKHCTQCGTILLSAEQVVCASCAERWTA